jgi:hypothetical protein
VVLLLAGCKGSAAMQVDLGPDLESRPPTDVPLRVDDLAAGLFFSVPVQLGDAPPFDALLDTGSAGLRVLPGAVPTSAFDSMTSTAIGGAFGSGTQIDGVLATARVTLGDRTTPTAIPIMAINAVSCTAAVPDCPAQGMTAEQFSFAQAYKAILGVGTRTSMTTPALGSPIVQLDGQPAFVIRAGTYDGNGGTLHIAPSSDELLPFKTLQLPMFDGGAALPNGAVAWNDVMVPHCVTDRTRMISYCAIGLLDCGTSTTLVRSSQYTGTPGDLPPGTDVEMIVGDMSSPIADFTFTVGTPPTVGLDEVVMGPPGAQGDRLTFGTLAFFRNDVLIDAANGTLGMHPH